MATQMTVADFIAKWRHHELKERSAAQEHFIDLCRLVGHQTPAQADPEGRWFTFERGAAKATGGEGWADVWKKGFFGWEYKGLSRDLSSAYRQLLMYFGALENPPLLVTCDTDRIVIHTHFPNTPTATHELTLEGLADADQFSKLRAVFHSPDSLRPDKTVQAITEEAATRITEIAQALRGRGIAAHRVARFLDRIVFCLFAEDVGLLPERLFTKVIENTQPNPEQFKQVVGELFSAMAHGGHFGAERIAYFNGDLFSDGEVLDVTADEMRILREVTDLDWSAIDASIFGTLFERALDPDKRSQLGAHYTSREDIELLIEPVVMGPLRREWAAVRGEAEALLNAPIFSRQRRDKASLVLRGFLNRLHSVTVLDPACGSGNFLFVTLQKLKDLEKEVIVFAARYIGGLFPGVSPKQLLAIELNRYAHELAQMTVWIGYLQWVKRNGLGDPEEPILQRMTTFENKDAVLAQSGSGLVADPEWPDAEFIVGNPPFLGGKKLRDSLGDEYVESLYRLWGDRVPHESDYCCYWFEKARKQIETGHASRAGLLATQAIRAGASRRVLERIKASGEIFFAESDRPWVLDGAQVRVSMVGFDKGTENTRVLDGASVEQINANLTATVDVTKAPPIASNLNIAFMGDTKGGDFELPESEALPFLNEANPHGRPNSDVLIPWVNGKDLTGRARRRWIVDFGTSMDRPTAALYEGPFSLVETRVKPARERSKTTIQEWWLHERRRGEMRRALKPLRRFIATSRVAKHRTFVWLSQPTLPDSRLYAFARSDDYFFGILQAKIHEVWSLATVSWHGVGNDPTYNTSTCFDPFPFPDATDEQIRKISEAARRLDDLRERWLNPPEWVRQETLTFPASIDGPWSHCVTDVNSYGIGTACYVRRLPVDEAAEKKLRKRTLTDLHNDPPTWLRDAYHELDSAVNEAYGFPQGADAERVLSELIALNRVRSKSSGVAH